MGLFWAIFGQLNKIDITNKECLESLFAEDFSSPYFPVLANLYMQEGDLRRAKLVCNTGLKYDSENHIAKFILAKIAICEEKLLVAEKLLKQLLVDTPCNFVAIRTLINLEFQLNRSPNTIYMYIQKILDFLPNDIECNSWLEKIKLPAKPNNNKNTQTNKTDKIDLSSEKETEELASTFLKKIKPGCFVIIFGEIGVGKTTFIRYLINQFQKLNKLEITEVTSPTFNLLNEYQINNFKINHYDLFRLKSSEEIKNLDLFEDIKN